MRWMIGRRSRRSASRGGSGGRLAPTLLAALALALVWAATAGSPATVHAADPGGPALSIVYPKPDDTNTSKGPVGANVTISATGLTTADSYTLNVASKDHTCAAATPVIANPFNANSDGTYTTTFPWPDSAAALGTSYILCLHDNTNASASDVASQQTYLVQSTTAPTIAIKHVSASATPGQATPPALDNSTYYPGDQIQINGSGFVPAQQLGAFLGAATGSPPATPADLGVGLKLQSGSLKSADDGSFSAIVQLPNATQLQPGAFQLCVASRDGSSNAPSAPPSLEACKTITVQTAPSPTPTVTATTAPPTATPGGGSTGGGGTPQNLGWIIGLGAVSVVLFFAGVVLLASAAAMPRPGASGGYQ